MHHSHSRKKKSKRFRTTECATIVVVQKKPNAQAAADKKIKLKRRTLYLLSYGGSDVVEKRRRLGILNNTAIGDRTQDHSLNFVNPLFRKFKNQKENTKKVHKKRRKNSFVWCNTQHNHTPPSSSSFCRKNQHTARGPNDNRLLKKKNLRRRRYRRRRSQRVIGKKEKEGKRRTPTPRKVYRFDRAKTQSDDTTFEGGRRTTNDDGW